MKRHQAFTLIELLVVISIIALLISILLPALGAARDTAKDLQCLSLLKQMQLANEVYAEENGDFYAPAGWNNNLLDDYPNNGGRLWFRQHMGFKDVMGVPYRAWWDTRWPTEFACPQADLALSRVDDNGAPYELVYGMNRTDFGWPPTVDSYRRATIRRPSESISLGDSMNVFIGVRNVADIEAYTGENNASINSRVAFRHGSEGANVAWYDGHASRINRQEAIENFQDNSSDDTTWFNVAPVN